MGIATSLVCSWESNIQLPNSQQVEILSSALGFNVKVSEMLISNPPNLACLTLGKQDKAVLRLLTSRLTGLLLGIAQRTIVVGNKKGVFVFERSPK